MSADHRLDSAIRTCSDGVYFFAYTWSVFPRIPEGSILDDVLPSLALGLGPAFLLARVVRFETLDVLQQDYVRTARNKWLSWRHLYWRDVLPNVMTPALTSSEANNTPPIVSAGVMTLGNTSRQ